MIPHHQIGGGGALSKAAVHLVDCMSVFSRNLAKYHSKIHQAEYQPGKKTG